ncbi:MAG: transporter [Streptosporangiaceae bacterium]|jgi:MFS family permease|nr:transporter [Streptosporangiaceae bacterium]
MSADSGRVSLAAPLRHRSFRCLAAGRMLAYLANSMAPVALSFAVLDLTGSTADLGLVVGTRSLANVILLLFGGVLADRVSRALVLQGSAVASAAVQGVLALSVLLGFTSIPLLLVLSGLNGALAAASMPAAAALTPQTVPPGEMRQANAVARMAMNLGVITGASVAGLLASVAGPGWALAVNAGAFVVVGLCYLGVRVPLAVTEGGRVRPFQDLREGWSEFVSRTWVWVVVLQFMVVNAVVAGGVQVLGPGIADATVGRMVWGLVLAAQMAGALAGGVVAVRFQVGRALLLGVAVVAVEAVPLLALAEAPVVWVLLVAMVLSGIALEQFGIAWDLSLQQNIPADRLARVYSYDALGSFMALPLGEMAAGPLAERLGTRATLVGGAVLVVTVTAACLCSRSVRSLAVEGVAGAGPLPEKTAGRPTAVA